MDLEAKLLAMYEKNYKAAKAAGDDELLVLSRNGADLLLKDRAPATFAKWDEEVARPRDIHDQAIQTIR